MGPPLKEPPVKFGRFVLGLLIVWSLVCESGIGGMSKPAYKGIVVDAETKKPLTGVVVVAIYMKRPLITGPGGGSSSPVAMRETQTDESGAFHFPSYRRILGPLSGGDNTVFYIFNRGYKPAQNSDEFLPKSPKSRRQYLVELKRLKTRAERRGVPLSLPGWGYATPEQLPLLTEAINEECKLLGLSLIRR